MEISRDERPNLIVPGPVCDAPNLWWKAEMRSALSAVHAQGFTVLSQSQRRSSPPFERTREAGIYAPYFTRSGSLFVRLLRTLSEPLTITS